MNTYPLLVLGLLQMKEGSADTARQVDAGRCFPIALSYRCVARGLPPAGAKLALAASLPLELLTGGSRRRRLP